MDQANTLPSPSRLAPDLSSGALRENASSPGRSTGTGWLGRLLRRNLLASLELIADGEIELHESGNVHRFGRPSDLRCRIDVLDSRTWERAALRGTIGFAECYMDGWVRMDDPVAVVRLFVRNRKAMESMESGLAGLSLPLLKLWHAARSNTRAGSRRNIEAHYDLGNDFYRLWLDESMMYSSAIWEHPDQSLHQASIAKLDRICRKLGLGPEHHILEIGTGWGSFAIHAAGRYGCRVTTTTISREQYDLATARVAEAGLADRVTILLDDYRDLQGKFDRVVSIEMVEAIGWRQYPTYFRTIGRLLKPDGGALIQAITIADRHYKSARRSVDFIQRHIFPGSCIPSISALMDAATSGSDLTVTHLEDIGPHYARTLREWRDRFQLKRAEIRAQGFSEKFVRMWDWYLAYCEGGYLERQLGNAQILFTKPEWKGDSLLGKL